MSLSNFKCAFQGPDSLLLHWKWLIFTALDWSVFEGPERGSAVRTVFQHRAKCNICFVLHFSLNSRWPRRISWALSTFSAWMRAIWGTVIFSHSRRVYYFCECGALLAQTVAESAGVMCWESALLINSSLGSKKYLPWKGSSEVILLTVWIVIFATSSHAHENGGNIEL